MVKRRSRTSGAQRAFQIIECLVDMGKPATAYQVAKTLGAPLSTIYESINLLEKLDILTRKGGEGKVFLGPRLYFYGLSYLRGLDADHIYRREANALSRRSRDNVQINVRDGDYLVVSAMVEGPDPYHVSTRVGSRVPLTWTASGRLFLGSMDAAERAEAMSRAVPSPVGRAVTDPSELERESLEAWQKGYCVHVAESDFAVSCVAAPVVNPNGACTATICLIVPESRAREHGAELGKMVMESARAIEKDLGWRSGRIGDEGLAGMHDE